MISCHLMGGLGNYLFQIAAGYSKSLDLGEKFVINPNNVQVVHKPLTFYTDNILKKITLDSNFNTNQVYYEPVFHYSPIPDFMLPTYLHGYFQSEKYFKNNREKILEFFTCNEVVDKIIRVVKNIRIKITDLQEFIIFDMGTIERLSLFGSHGFLQLHPREFYHNNFIPIIPNRHRRTESYV
jgi:hypothetical protein